MRSTRRKTRIMIQNTMVTKLSSISARYMRGFCGNLHTHRMISPRATAAVSVSRNLDAVPNPSSAGQNLSMRMSIRRFTRLTNAFSKKIENHAAAVALWFTYYNFCRVHSTLRVTPAMEAGICGHVWSIEELCDLLPENHKIGVETDKALILKALGEKIG
jgi:hypothetical protein